MDNWTETLKNIIKIIFYLLLPAMIIFFRFKKKIKTGFAVGMILTSFILGVFGTASIVEDPIKRFERNINSKNHIEAKKSLKIIIQFGPDYLNKVDLDRIVYKDLYAQIKDELIKEYSSISKRYLTEYSIKKDFGCKELEIQEANLVKLQHALRLIDYSESIGGQHTDLREKLVSKISSGKEYISTIKQNCDKK